jgi:hypothetical protein
MSETDEIETERLSDVQWAADGGTRFEDFMPGTFGCHEAMHMASVLVDMVGNQLLEHPAILQNADWYRAASQARQTLFQLYQAIGAEHLAPREREIADG